MESLGTKRQALAAAAMGVSALADLRPAGSHVADDRGTSKRTAWGYNDSAINVLFGCYRERDAEGQQRRTTLEMLFWRSMKEERIEH